MTKSILKSSTVEYIEHLRKNELESLLLPVTLSPVPSQGAPYRNLERAQLMPRMAQLKAKIVQLKAGRERGGDVYARSTYGVLRTVGSAVPSFPPIPVWLSH